MSRDEIIQALEASVSKTVEITYTEDVPTCLTEIQNVDDEGFVHRPWVNTDGKGNLNTPLVDPSHPNTLHNPHHELFWTTFDDVADVKAKSFSH